MCTAALFLIAKTQKQRTCPLIGEQMNKWVHPDNGKVFSTKK